MTLPKDTLSPEKLADGISRGLSLKEIAQEAGCSQTTIARHFRKHNLQPLNRKGVKPGTKPFLCKTCGETDPKKFRKQWFNLSYSKCKRCHSIQQSKRHAKNRLRLIELFGGECHFCGYDKYHGSLHFHHLDPSKKDPDWINLKNTHNEKLMEELSKCILVCANCHGEIHGGFRDNPSDVVVKFGPKEKPHD
jgi:AraC-like DNA-binding protein